MRVYEQAWFPFAFMAFGLIVHVLGIGNFSIYILDEAKNAAAAMEMEQQQEWILPTFNGIPRFDKPPLHYYFFMLSYKIFGVNPVGARIFPALLGWICFLTVYFLSVKSFGKKAAFFAGLALLSSVHWLLQFHLAVPDPFLILFLFLTIVCYGQFATSKYLHKNYLRASAVFLGFATLSKGPVALVLVSMTVLVFMVLDKKPFKAHIKSILDLKACLLFIVVSLPWYVLITWKTDGLWLKTFIFHHNLNRFSAPMEGHGGGFYLTFVYVFIGLLPACVVLFPAFKQMVIKWRIPTIVFLATIFSIVTVLFFSISGTKLPNYTVPVYPFLAILVGWYFGGGEFGRFRLPSHIASIYIIVISVGLFLAPHFVVVKEIDSISKWFVTPALMGFFALISAHLKKWETSWIMASLGFVAFSIVLFTDTLPAIDQKNPVLQSQGIWKEAVNVFYFRDFNPAFVFNMKKPVLPVQSQINNLRQGDLILTSKKSLPDFQGLGIKTTQVFEGYDLFEDTMTIILSVD